jgi:hypothetical protein
MRPTWRPSVSGFGERSSVPQVHDIGIQIEPIQLLHTSPDETREAAGVAGTLAHAMRTRVALVHFRLPAFEGMPPRPIDDLAPVVRQLETSGIGVDVRVYVGRIHRKTIPLAFKAHSLVVLGGHRGSWFSAAERWRRMLESAGHFVVFVDASDSKEPSRA